MIIYCKVKMDKTKEIAFKLKAINLNHAIDKIERAFYKVNMEWETINTSVKSIDLFDALVDYGTYQIKINHKYQIKGQWLYI